jgi:hypothetical protein
MTITILGELSLASVVPLLGTYSAALSVANGFALPELSAKLLGLNNVLVAVTVAPPALGATITAAIATVAQLQAAIGGPTVTLQIGAITAQIALLLGLLGDLTAGAAITIPSGTVSAYVYDGPSGAIGDELQSAIDGTLPGGPGHCNALILATTSPADWAALAEVFAV